MQPAIKDTYNWFWPLGWLPPCQQLMHNPQSLNLSRNWLTPLNSCSKHVPSMLYQTEILWAYRSVHALNSSFMEAYVNVRRISIGIVLHGNLSSTASSLAQPKGHTTGWGTSSYYLRPVMEPPQKMIKSDPHISMSVNSGICWICAYVRWELWPIIMALLPVSKKKLLCKSQSICPMSPSYAEWDKLLDVEIASMIMLWNVCFEIVTWLPSWKPAAGLLADACLFCNVRIAW